MACNTAIFYDIENLMGIFSGKTNTNLHLDEIYKRVLEMDGVTGVSIQRAYADWGVPQHKYLKNSVLQVGIEPIHIFNTNQNDKVKNAADVSLMIDAVDLAARRPEIQNFVIASGDGIFAFLSKKLHEHGKRVIGCSYEKIANAIFRNSCDYFITLEKAEENIVATATNRNMKPISKAKQKKLAALPKTKYTEVLLAADIEIQKDPGDTAGVMHMIRQLVEALFVDETKDLPGLEISIFMTYIKHYLPSFKVQQHGFKRIGELMQFVLSGSGYCTYSVHDNVVLMAPRSVAAQAGGKIVNDVDGLLIVTPEGDRYNSVFNVPLGTPFVYSISQAKPKSPQKQKPGRKPAPAKAAKVVSEVVPGVIPKEDTIRKLAETIFEELSRTNALPAAEIGRLTTLDHARKVLGVRAPIFIKLDAKSNVRELRLVKGKVKYWKEIFEFNGGKYLVFKEWANLHKDRLLAWHSSFAQKSES